MTAEDGAAEQGAAVVQFAQPTEPVASVIVLAWRLTDQLVDCLRSLAASQDAPSFEVQLVLNGASPETRAIVAEQVRGAHIVDLEANVGYGGGCNAAALRSRGEFFILLNDDTLVDPLWLRTIVDAARSAPKSVGAVASVLLNLDGTLQEAGSRVLPGAGTVQFGKGMPLVDAVAAGYLSKRPIDYGSGAALLIRRSVFEEVGGFDPIFEPAYFEDVDLCFRMRHAGYTTVLEPKAWVRHASGGSTAKYLRFREWASWRSGKHFIERWKPVLAHAPAANAPIRQLCDPTLLEAKPIPGAPDEVRDPVPSTRTALEIATGYQAWLEQQLDAAREGRRGADAERIRELGAQVATLSNRIADLESRGLLGMLKWRAGIWVRQRQARREAAVSGD